MANVSVVVTGRNDNYDGNFDERLVIALSKNISRLPNAEFIFVEWNPYLDRPLVSEKLKKVFGHRVKYFVVHPKYHSKYCTIDGFLEYPAKNAGVRRASGEYILCTNSDVILAPETAFVMNGELKPNMIYRTVRVDIREDYLDVNFPLPEKYVLERNKGLTNACGDFLLMHSAMWNHVTGYCEDFPEQRLHKDSYIVHKLVDVHKFPHEFIGDITHWRHPSSWSNGYIRPKVGDVNWDYTQCGWEKNKDTWGLTLAKEEVNNGITWLS